MVRRTRITCARADRAPPAVGPNSSLRSERDPHPLKSGGSRVQVGRGPADGVGTAFQERRKSRKGIQVIKKLVHLLTALVAMMSFTSAASAIDETILPSNFSDGTPNMTVELKTFQNNHTAATPGTGTVDPGTGKVSIEWYRDPATGGILIRYKGAESWTNWAIALASCTHPIPNNGTCLLNNAGGPTSGDWDHVP